MNIEKAVSRNAFWNIIRTELPKHGYKQFHPEQAGNHSFVVVIEGLNSQGLPHKQKYHFPKIGRSFESTLNFKSSLRNFVKQELPNRGFYPPADHRVRQPGMFIAKINHDVEKKPLATPKPMLQALADMKPDQIDVLVPPYIPEEKPAPVAVPVVNKVHSNEPVSDSMVLAVFLLDARELSTMIDVCSGVAKFRGSRPAPLRILTQATPPVAKPITPPIEQQDAKPPVKRISVQDAIVQRMYTKVKKVWTPSDFEDLVRAKNSLSANLSMLATSKRVKRIGVGQYIL
jgi:hypothetical protein